MITKSQLEAVYRLIEAPERWTKTKLARNTNKEAVGPLSEDAACWCLLGAAYCVMRNMRRDVMEELETALGICDVGIFNDDHSHAEVLSLLKCAIERAT